MSNQNKVLSIVLIVLCWCNLTWCNGRLENDIVIYENCTIADLKNISQIHTDPTHVAITSCTLNEIPNALFIKYEESLQALEITESRITNIQDYAFNDLKILELLNLSKNNLTTVRSWSAQQLESLQLLDLRHNIIRVLDKTAFVRYPNLTRLNLAHNIIEYIPENIFRSNPNLHYLNLAYNQICAIKETTFKGLHKLTHLALDHNEIKTIDSLGFSSITHLEHLRLEDNKLVSIDIELFSYLPRLVFLNVSNNDIDMIANETFKKNIELIMLDISYNEIDGFDESGQAFSHLEGVEVLNISHNKIYRLNKNVFKEFINLKVLDLSGNDFSLITENLFEFTPSIQQMNLSFNSIRDIDTDIFANLTQLMILDLAHNKLDLDNFLDSTPNLMFLNLSSNQYNTLNMSRIYGLQSVDLYNNPWNCKWLIQQMMEGNTRLNFGSGYMVDSFGTLLEVPGLDCYTEDGIFRSFIVMGAPMIPSHDYAVEKVERNKTSSEIPIHFHNASQILDDTFDLKSSIIWLGIGIVVVFGLAKVVHIILKKSEKKTDAWRTNQLGGLNNFQMEMLMNITK